MEVKTKAEAEALGYVVEAASQFEVGLLKISGAQTRGIRTWFCQDFDRELPPLDHPKILAAINIEEEREKQGW